ncbi:MAG: hypothetical protein MRY83_14420 [Flavobacteriales bacterium]|nr:hypothetical protein [Flavobacteriales bacterium]
MALISRFLLVFSALLCLNFTYTGDSNEEVDAGANAPSCYREISPRLSGYYVELKILPKRNISNVARLYENVPKGYAAKPYKLSGAQLLPNDKKLRLIWYGLPMQDTVSISYFLIPESSEVEKPELTGKFQYLDDNFKRAEVNVLDQL